MAKVFSIKLIETVDARSILPGTYEGVWDVYTVTFETDDVHHYELKTDIGMLTHSALCIVTVEGNGISVEVKRQ